MWGVGLGVDYDGSRTASSASTNYSLQNYANDVVATVKECCMPHNIPVPTLVSESGRAIASHFSVLVFNVLGCGQPPEQEPAPQPDEPLPVRNLRETLFQIRQVKDQPEVDISLLQEAWNDAVKFRDDALAAFRLGYIRLDQRAMAEQLSWACAQAIQCAASRLQTDPRGPTRSTAGSGLHVLRQPFCVPFGPRHLGHRSALPSNAHSSPG